MYMSVTYMNNTIHIKINKYFNKDSADSIISSLSELYNSIDTEFILVADLLDINIIKINPYCYKKIAEMFSNEHDVSDKFLKYIVIISKSNIVKNVLTGFFKLYSMRHKFYIVKNSNFNSDLK